MKKKLHNAKTTENVFVAAEEQGTQREPCTVMVQSDLQVHDM